MTNGDLPSATHALPCIVCGCQLEQAIPVDIVQAWENQPYAGTAFTTRGHYGSTVFDPTDASMLELNVCDPCLTRVAAEGKVIVHAGPKDHRLWTTP
jgi:hypothetical protein